MSRASRYALSVLALLAVPVIAMNACNDVRLTLKPKELPVVSAKASSEVCALPPNSTEFVTKIMFLVDKSGSNFGDAAQNIPGTDPDKSFRFNLINDFFQKHRNNQQIHWGFIEFHQDKATPYIGTGATASFSNDPAQMDNALNRLRTEVDTNATPYRAALTMAQSAIILDREASRAARINTTYVVVLMSDGVPTDYGVPETNIDDNAIDADVRSLIVAGGGATLNTIYYGPEKPEASSRLARMAAIGGGRFSDVNRDGVVPLDNILARREAEPWAIKRFMITNLNASPCDDGLMGADSDADGLCDKDELRYNEELKSQLATIGKKFDPVNRYSFDTIYNDLFWYRSVVYGEFLDPACIPEADEDKDLLNSCEETQLFSVSPSGPTLTWLNKMKNDADRKNFDSDGDGFLDWIEFAFGLGRAKNVSLDFNSFRQEVDGFRMDQILLQHRNPKTPSRGVAYDGLFRFERVNAKGQNCYRYEQSVLPLYPVQGLPPAATGGHVGLEHGANQNVILIYFIQSPEKDPNGPGELRYTFQKMDVTQTELKLNLAVENYQSYNAKDARVNQ